MANPKHLKRLSQGMEKWNQWREKNPDVEEIDLRGTNLSGANLRDVNLSGANLSGANLNGADLGSVNLSGANLSGADLTGVNLDDAKLSQANLSQANLSQASLYSTDLSNTDLNGVSFSKANLYYGSLFGSDLSNSDFHGATLRGVILSNANLTQVDFSHANLIGADLIGVDLSYASFIGADLRKSDLRNASFIGANLSTANLSTANLNTANLTGADLTGANLGTIQALGTNFQSATLTGACIEDWHINSHTNLQEIVCEYIFTRYDYKQQQFADRRPHNASRIFIPGEFTKRYQVVLESVELFFDDGIDWRAFLSSLEELKAQYGDELNIQGIERKTGGSLVVRLEVPSDADKGAVERAIKESYEAKLQVVEAQYRAQLQELKIQHSDEIITLYRQHNAEMREITKCLADKPIIVEAKAVAENHSSSDTYNTTVLNNSGNIANKMQNQASQQANQYIGANLNEIAALIQSLRGIAETFPTEKREEANVHLDDLEDDLQHPEKRKPNRIKTRLTALLMIAVQIGSGIATATDFTNNVLELSKKLEIPIEQVEPQSPQKNAINVKAIGSD